MSQCIIWCINIEYALTSFNEKPPLRDGIYLNLHALS